MTVTDLRACEQTAPCTCATKTPGGKVTVTRAGPAGEPVGKLTDKELPPATEKASTATFKGLIIVPARSGDVGLGLGLGLTGRGGRVTTGLGLGGGAGAANLTTGAGDGDGEGTGAGEAVGDGAGLESGGALTAGIGTDGLIALAGDSKAPVKELPPNVTANTPTPTMNLRYDVFHNRMNNPALGHATPAKKAGPIRLRRIVLRAFESSAIRFVHCGQAARWSVNPRFAELLIRRWVTRLTIDLS